MPLNTMDENATLQAILSTAETALTARPAMAGIIQPFTDLFCRRAHCAAPLSGRFQIGDLADARERLLAGAPILTSLPPAFWNEPLNAAWACMLSAIQDVFPSISADIEAISSACDQGCLPIANLITEYLDGSFKGYESAAQAIDVSADTLGFVMRTVISTASEAMLPIIQAEIGQVSWYRGVCPVCGSLPVIGFLSRPPALSGEFLKESGGQRFLHCGLCGHDWRFDRHTCPVCDNSEPDTRFYLSDPDCPAERVDICRQCGCYLPAIDLRERNDDPHLDTAAVCMVYLDILAQKQGFSPMSAQPWNRLSD